MIKLDLNFMITNLDGSPAIDENKKAVFMHHLFANLLINSALKEHGDYMRKNVLAEALYSTGILELDEANLKLIKEIVEDPAITPRVQCLLARCIAQAEKEQKIVH
jgi:hypothetical protein